MGLAPKGVHFIGQVFQQLELLNFGGGATGELSVTAKITRAKKPAHPSSRIPYPDLRYARSDHDRNAPLEPGDLDLRCNGNNSPAPFYPTR